MANVDPETSGDLHSEQIGDVMKENLSKEICRALEASEWDRVQELLSLVPDGETLPVWTVSAQQTALHLAVEFNAEPEIVEALLVVYPHEEANKPDKFDNTPLHLCCRDSPFFGVFRSLVDAWPAAILHENRRSHTPLDDFFQRDENEDDEEPWDPVAAMTVILNACPAAIHHVDREGRTLLHRCLKHGGAVDIVQMIPPFLLERKPELAHMLDNNSVSALHEACKREDSLPVVQDLMRRCTRDECMHRDVDGRTVLHYAICWSSSVDVVRELVTASHELIQVRDESGKTPMDYLLSFYAPEFSSSSIQSGWNSFLDNVVDMVRAFFVAGPHAEKTRDGALYLHSALYTVNCPIPIIEFLVVAASEQVEEFDDLGNLPLHLAAALPEFDESQEQSYVEVIHELLERYPEAARTPNPDGFLPLHLMIAGRRTWHCGIDKVVEVHPAAICDLNLNAFALSHLMARMDQRTMYRMLQEASYLVFES